VVGGDRIRQEFAEFVGSGAPVAVLADDLELLGAELRERLAAHAAGSDAVACCRGDSDAFERLVAVTDRVAKRYLLGVEAVRVVRVLDVATGVHRAVCRPERCADIVLGVGRVRVVERLACVCQQIHVRHLARDGQIATGHRDFSGLARFISLAPVGVRVCTLTLAWQVFEDAPVVVAANRDELLDRPSEPPAVRDWETTVVAPIDREAGGTWLGYNEHGLLVGLTNRWTGESVQSDRSRGLLVREALGQESATEAVRFVERELDERTYEGFNLIAADASAGLLVEYDGRRAVRNLSPGIHVVVNVGADGSYDVPEARSETGVEQANNADAVQAALRPDPGETSQSWLDRAASVLGDHEYGVCLHHENFGTRSSSLIRLGTDDVTYRFADGPPCKTSFEAVEAADIR